MYHRRTRAKLGSQFMQTHYTECTKFIFNPRVANSKFEGNLIPVQLYYIWKTAATSCKICNSVKCETSCGVSNHDLYNQQEMQT